jgi:hypothetical protein
MRLSDVCSALHGPGIAEFKRFEKEDLPSKPFCGAKRNRGEKYCFDKQKGGDP